MFTQNPIENIFYFGSRRKCRILNCLLPIAHCLLLIISAKFFLRPVRAQKYCYVIALGFATTLTYLTLSRLSILTPLHPDYLITLLITWLQLPFRGWGPSSLLSRIFALNVENHRMPERCHAGSSSIHTNRIEGPLHKLAVESWF